MNPLAVVGAIAIGAPIVFVLLIAGSAWRAYWLYPAWRWFVMPLGVPAISFWHFAALLMLVSLVTNHTDEKKDERRHDWYATLAGFLLPILAWVTLRWMHGR